MIVRQPFLILQKRTAGREELSRLFKTTADRHQKEAAASRLLIVKATAPYSIGKIRLVDILQKSCNESFHSTQQREVLPHVYQHPVSNGITKEVRTKTNEKYHDDTGEDCTNDAAADTTSCIFDDGSTVILEETGYSQRNDDSREHTSCQDDGNG